MRARYLIQRPNGHPYGLRHEITFGMLDLSNPKTVDWVEGLVERMALSAGVDAQVKANALPF